MNSAARPQARKHALHLISLTECLLLPSIEPLPVLLSGERSKNEKAADLPAWELAGMETRNLHTTAIENVNQGRSFRNELEGVLGGAMIARLGAGSHQGK